MDFLKTFLNTTLNILQFAILIRVLLSWIPNSQNNRFGYLIYQITEPVLGLIRRVMPNTGMFDLSPLVAFLILGLVQQLLAGSF